MKGDFSRLTFDRTKHYSDVLLQQGRVLLDADWNEQQHIARYRTETEAADMIGPSGVPAAGGLEIRTSTLARSLSIVKVKGKTTLKGWIVGAQTSILHWDGSAFKAQKPPQNASGTLRTVCFVDEKNGWAAGDQGLMLHTKDGGVEWEKQADKTDNHLKSVYALKFGETYLVCAVGAKGTLLYSADGGKTWKKQDVALKADLNAVHILPLPDGKKVKVYAVGNSRTILEFSWDPKTNKLTFIAAKFSQAAKSKPDLYAVNAMFIEKKEVVLAAGEQGEILLKGDDAWEPQTSGISTTIKAVLASPGGTGPFGGKSGLLIAAVAEDGSVCFSGDGKGWLAFQTRTTEKVAAVNFIDCNRADNAPPLMTLLGNKGGLFNQTDNGWSLFAQLIYSMQTSAGRIYVDGILCEFEKNASLQMPQDTGQYLVYLDCRRRHITAAQDPQIREAALGGPDTCTRLQTVAQVKYLRVASKSQMEKVEELRADARELAEKVGAAATRAASDDNEIIGATALIMANLAEITHEEAVISGVNINNFVLAQKEKLSAGMLEKVKDNLEAWEKVQTRIVETLTATNAETTWKNFMAANACALAASVKKADARTNACTIAAGGGYTGLENQLYRVEIHRDSDAQGGPTFKWSRDNGSVIFPFEIVSVNDNKTTVRLTSPDLGSYYPVSKEEWIGAWVEVINDTYELGGETGILMQIADVPSDSEMVLDGSLTLATWSNKTKHPVIRRWDQRDDAKKAGAVAVTENVWIDLECGVQIRFEKGGTYRTGDYWLIPARTDAADVEWPKESGEAAFLPPAGIDHHYAQLALLSAVEVGTNKMIVTEFHDSRDIFEPLAKSALHVTGINWTNDSLVEFTAKYYTSLLIAGFQITLDEAPDTWTVNTSSVLVTMEMPNGLTIPVPGLATVKGNIIIWQMKAQTATKAPSNTINLVNLEVSVNNSILHSIANASANIETGNAAAVPTVGVNVFKVRITLKGGLIFRTCAGKRIYLDGQAFGKPRNDQDEEGKAALRYDLEFPSGAGHKASDFESWITVRQITVENRKPGKASGKTVTSKTRAKEKK